MKAAPFIRWFGSSRSRYPINPSATQIGAWWCTVAGLACLLAPFRSWSADCAPPPSGLVAWWPAEGNANDIVGTNNGALFGGASFAGGEVGQAFSFDGTNGYVQIPDSDALKPANVTIEAWVWLDPNLPSNNGGEQIVFKKNTSTAWFEGYSLSKTTINNGDGTYSDRFQFCVSRAGDQVAINSQTIAQRGVWYHVGATYDGNQSILYINGVAEVSATPGFALDYDTDPVFIGTTGTWAPYLGMFGGRIDEVSIYNRALSAAEIAAIYNSGSAGKCRVISPRAATASATVVNGFVVGATIIDGGYGYTNTPAVRFIGEGGSGAQAVAVVSNGMVIAVNVVAAGFGYTSTPTVVIEPPFIPPPTMAIGTASLLSFTNLAVGANYQLQFFSGNTWSNLGGAFTAASSSFTQYVLGATGPDAYRLASTPVPAQAYATGQVVNGFVVGATVTSGGSGYTTNPAVSIVGGGGSRATALATVSSGVVIGLIITEAGIGYTNIPIIIIAPPPVNALWPMVSQAVKLDLGSLAPYDNYQLEFSPVLGGAWSNLSSPLTPAATTTTQYINVSGNAGFFRVSYLP